MACIDYVPALCTLPVIPTDWLLLNELDQNQDLGLERAEAVDIEDEYNAEAFLG